MMSVRRILGVLVVVNCTVTTAVDGVRRMRTIRRRHRRNEALPIFDDNNDQQRNMPLPQLDATNFLAEEQHLTQQEHQSSARSKGTVIIHIGPHKTGTTTIQTFIRNYLDVLRQDNYELPGDWFHRPQGAVNMMGLVKCYTTQFIDDCDTASLNDIRTFGEQQANILITAESFSYSNANLSKLYDTFSPYYADENIYVIAYYRRFYDWLVSYWNQFNKELPYEKRQTFVEYIKDMKRLDTLYYRGPYIFGVSQRYEEYFTNVKYYNMYNMTPYSDSIETFFCDAIPNSPKTCDKHRNRPSNERSKHVNESRELVYEDLLHTAIRLLNLDFDNIDTKVLADKVKHRQEQELNLTEYDFDYKICPDEKTLKILYDRTIQSERSFFPDYFAAKGENEIKEKYEIDRTKKLCSIDTTAVLQNSLEWQNFFHQLEKDQFSQ